MADGQHHHHGDGTAGGGRVPPGDGEGPAAEPGVRRSTRWKVARWAALGLSVVVLLTAGAGAFVFFRLNGNLRDMPLFGGVRGDAGSERPDAFGRTPLNVLVIGSDARSAPEDCRLGGDCGPGRNADVEMVLHIAADRSHATVLSIPRDTVTRLPACRIPTGGIAPARRGPVNATLQYGPGCTVAAVHALTALPIDHFVMVDFAGVVRMSNAVGGVPVCVDRDVYDPYAHLRLAAGRHELKGEGALAFLRSRHAFGDGSDLGRTDAQHLFLGALAHRMRVGGGFSDPSAMLSLADAATKALTVDTGLASVPKLTGLTADVRKVPSARFTFTTMPSRPDPRAPERLVPAPAAKDLFAAIAADRPVRATGSGGPPADPGQARPEAGPAAAGPPADETFEDETTAPRPPTPAPAPSPGRPATAPAARVLDAAHGGACAKVATIASVTVRGAAMTPTAAFAATPQIPVSAR
ncbi:LCP family protein [Streptomyces sp. NBC_01190]|uniref:LCP family protein n=1 Tax=Streptomyces sp. NBC_01190 TaxID=2903767 RepID=UPI00386A175D|nr:LCP family protein [Streptomyces sp. NBC_01190]